MALGRKKKNQFATIAACAKRQIESNKPISTHVSVPDLCSCKLDLSISSENRLWKLAAESRLHIKSPHVCKFYGNSSAVVGPSRSAMRKKFTYSSRSFSVCIFLSFWANTSDACSIAQGTTQISGVLNDKIFSTMQIYCS